MTERKSDSVNRTPVFILGLHRSGTTLLYEMLAASGCFNIVTARHVICFDELRNGTHDRERARCRLSAWFEDHGLADRGVDAVSLGPDTPEEYGFILERCGVGVSITRRNFRVFQMICTAIARDHDQLRPLLLKNPWDFGHGRLIRELVPGAKIVYIHRNPFHVLGSSVRMLQKAVEAPHPYLAALSDGYRRLVESEFPWRVAQRFAAAAPGLLALALIRIADRSARGYMGSVQADLGHRWIDVRYETLCERPDETIREILSHCGLVGGGVDYASMIGRHSSRVDPAIARRKHRVVSSLNSYASVVGYDMLKLADAI